VYSIVLATLWSGARIAYGGDFRRGVGYARHLVGHRHQQCELIDPLGRRRRAGSRRSSTS
jgi:hypothetical protein